MKPLTMAVVAAVGFALAACQSGKNDPVAQVSPDPSSVSTAVALQALDLWRQNLKSGSVGYLHDLKEINPAFQERDLASGLDTCLDVLRQQPRSTIYLDARLRFANPATGPLSSSDATRIVGTATRWICPGLGWIEGRTGG
jgi:hypothetical protein